VHVLPSEQSPGAETVLKDILEEKLPLALLEENGKDPQI